MFSKCSHYNWWVLLKCSAFDCRKPKKMTLHFTTTPCKLRTASRHREYGHILSQYYSRMCCAYLVWSFYNFSVRFWTLTFYEYIVIRRVATCKPGKPGAYQFFWIPSTFLHPISFISENEGTAYRTDKMIPPAYQKKLAGYAPGNRMYICILHRVLLMYIIVLNW